MIDAPTLARLLPDYLPRQRWYGAADRELTGVDVVAFDELSSEYPALVWGLAEASFADGGTARYQLFVGLRDDYEPFLDGKGRYLLGDVDTTEGVALAYVALDDPTLALRVLALVAPDEEVHLVRPLTVDQSNTSIVYDERLILKVFRRIHPGSNPDAEVTRALAGVGFDHISAPVADWTRDGTDLAVLRTYLVGAPDGFHLAQTSLRDLSDSRLPPEACGGDFAPESRRLGQITAAMHLALAQPYGTTPAEPAAWAADMESHLDRIAPTIGSHVDVEAARARYRELAKVGAGAGAAGPDVRIHGDLHLGQTMRTDNGWYLLDFEGEPGRPVEERRRPSAALRDVAGMVRSFHYASRVTLAERGEEADDELAELGERWEARAADAFRAGYPATSGIEELLPAHDADRQAVLDSFLLDKAVYEVGYEMANRPDWVPIPVDAVHRVLRGA